MGIDSPLNLNLYGLKYISWTQIWNQLDVNTLLNQVVTDNLLLLFYGHGETD